jgi:hypothetical protein
MTMIEFEASIERFLWLGRELQKVPSLTAARALDDLLSWNRSSRILGAELDDDGDMLLLQCGSTRRFRFTELTDLRKLGDGDRPFSEAAYYSFIDLTRQVFASDKDSKLEFDDVAVQMSVTLLYGPGREDERGSDVWVWTPEHIEAGVEKFSSLPFVKEWLTRPALRTVITVDPCG